MTPRPAHPGRFLGPLAATGLLLGGAALAAPAGTAAPTEIAARLAAAVEADLRDNVLPYWLARAPDPRRGGLVGEVDHREVEQPDAPRGALLASRVLWTFSAAHRRWPDGGYLPLARRAHEALFAQYWDPAHGGFAWSVAADGAALDPRKQTYGQAFGLHALSEFHRATGDAGALARAQELFRLLEQHARDRVQGGYGELFAVDWSPLDPRAAAVMGPAGAKSQNTHLHLLEAYTSLLRVWPDGELRAALHALVELMLDRVLDARTGHLGLFFEADWRPVAPGRSSYGHDIEAAWLLTEAATVVGEPAQLARARQAAVAIARVTLAEGADAEGALLYEGGPDGPTDRRRDWWPQAEGLVGFVNAWQISGDRRFLDAAARLWAFVERRFVDRAHGGWFNSLNPDGTPAPLPKIGFWKCPYHNGRAALELLARLGDATGAPAALQLNDLEYLEMSGLNVMLAHDFYPEGHQGGVGFVQHGARVATNGDLRLEPTPGQWQPVPKVGPRRVDRATGEISVRLEYPDPAKDGKGFNPIAYPDLALAYVVRVRPEGAAFRIQVDLEQPLPAAWVGRVGFNLELFPGALFGRTFAADGQVGSFPRQPNGPGAEAGADGYQFAPLARGPVVVIAPESDAQRVRFEDLRTGDLQLLDGRAQHDNGWFVLRSLVPAEATAGAIDWRVTPHVQPGWKSAPVVQVSQVGYHPAQEKVAVIELARADTARPPARLVRIAADGTRESVLEQPAQEWGRFLRFHYLQFDFSAVTAPGMYQVEFGAARSGPFAIGSEVYRRHVWQPTLEYFLPVQMCHVRVNDRYRVWHGACHLDDARMAPVKHNHFDGYVQGASTLTRFAPGERVPGLNRGGWHDAGDYDLRVESQAETVRGLALIHEEFHVAHDNTTVDEAAGVVELHRPDGRPDVLQQIAHGVRSLVGGYRSLGRLYRGIIAPTLRQYVLLGDAANQTDGRPYAAPAPGAAVPPVGVPGGPDDRWVFTEENPAREALVGAGLAAGGRALRGYDDALAGECLAIARELWERTGASAGLNRVHLAAELFLATGAPEYAEEIVAARPAIVAAIAQTGWLMGRVVGRLGAPEFTAAITDAVRAHRAEVGARALRTPYGVPYEPAIWGAGWGIQHFGRDQYFLHTGFPEIFPAKFMLRALNFVLGSHPGPNTASFVSGVGARSLTVAYGANRADWSYIPGGIGSGTALIRPDLPELLEWPFLWQQTEYVLGGGTTDYLFLALAADRVLSGP